MNSRPGEEIAKYRCRWVLRLSFSSLAVATLYSISGPFSSLSFNYCDFAFVDLSHVYNSVLRAQLSICRHPIKVSTRRTPSLQMAIAPTTIHIHYICTAVPFCLRSAPRRPLPADKTNHKAVHGPIGADGLLAFW